MSDAATARPGRPAAATRDEAVALAARRLLAAERVDVQAIARELGSRGRRCTAGSEPARDCSARCSPASVKNGSWRSGGSPRRGPSALLECFDRFNREVSETRALGVLLAQEQERALRILISSAGPVQPRMVALIEKLLTDEIEAGAFAPASPPTLAYAIVRLAESFIYNDAMVGILGDTERLRGGRGRAARR